MSGFSFPFTGRHGRLIKSYHACTLPESLSENLSPATARQSASSAARQDFLASRSTPFFQPWALRRLPDKLLHRRRAGVLLRVGTHGRVVGDLLGSRRPFRQQIHSFFQNIRLFLKGMSRYPGYNRATRDFIGWILRNSWRKCLPPRDGRHTSISTCCPKRKAWPEPVQ